MLGLGFEGHMIIVAIGANIIGISSLGSDAVFLIILLIIVVIVIVPFYYD